jgi:hypothetical protein
MGFDAAEATPDLDWDFSKYGAGSGVTPEPSEVQINRFTRQLQEVTQTPDRLKAATSTRTTSTRAKKYNLQAALDVIRNVDGGDDDAIALSHELSVVIAAVCSDSPTASQIDKLPFRVRMAYFGWVVGQFTDPKAWMPATSSSVPMLNGASGIGRVAG